MQWDWSILDAIQTLRTGFGDAIMPWLSRLGDGGVVWIVLAVVLLLYPKTRRTGVAVAVALLLDVLLCNGILKPLAARVRPCVLRPEVELLIACPTDYSFPSGHTAASFAATSALCFCRSRLGIPAGILACLIAFSRLYLYVHFPSDVLAGIVLGILFGCAGAWVSRRLPRRKKSRK